MAFIRWALVAVMACVFLAGCGDRADRAKLQAAEASWRKGEYKEAAEVFKALAEKGNAHAQFLLAETYLSGNGLPQDYALALKWATAGAEQKDSNAQLTLGGIYEDGRGVPVDVVQAHMWYSLSATSGDEQAIRKKAELEIKKMKPAQVEQAVQMQLAWSESHRKH